VFVSCNAHINLLKVILKTCKKIGHTDKKINKETLELNDTTDQIDLTDIYRLFHPATAQYTFFSPTHGTFSKTDHKNM
jgi:exonuclease III